MGIHKMEFWTTGGLIGGFGWFVHAKHELAKSGKGKGLGKVWEIWHGSQDG